MGTQKTIWRGLVTTLERNRRSHLAKPNELLLMPMSLTEVTGVLQSFLDHPLWNAADHEGEIVKTSSACWRERPNLYRGCVSIRDPRPGMRGRNIKTFVAYRGK
jgi:hypothetical protein